MGTRGLYGVYVNGKVKASYSHSDSYPSHLGKAVLSVVKDIVGNGVEEARLMFDAVSLVDQDDKIKQTSMYCKKGETYYNALREYQGEPHLRLILDGHLGVMTDDKGFAGDSGFCEYAYIIDLDNKTFDCYKGFQSEPQAGNPFGQDASQDEYDNGEKGDVWYPVKCIASIPFDKLKDVSDMDEIYRLSEFGDDGVLNLDDLKNETDQKLDGIKDDLYDIVEGVAVDSYGSPITGKSNTKRFEFHGRTAKGNPSNKYWELKDLGNGKVECRFGKVGSNPIKTITYDQTKAMMKAQEKLNEGYTLVA